MKIVEPSSLPQEDKPRDPMQSKLDQLDTLAKNMGHSENIEGLDLPSQYAFMNVQTVTIRPLKWREFMLLGEAQQSGSVRSVCEAVGATVVNYDYLLMSWFDFQTVMYWQRAKLKKPYRLTWQCNRDAHTKLIADGKAQEDSRLNETLVKASDLAFVFPDFDTLKELLINDDDEIYPGLPIQPINVRDRLEALDEPVEDQQRHATLNRFAGFVNDRVVKKPSLAAKREYLDIWMMDTTEDHFEVLEKLTKLEKAMSHGIKETINTKCKVCGEEHNVTLSFSPADFFPEVLD